MFCTLLFFFFCYTWSCRELESVWSLSCLISTWVSRTSSQLVFRMATAHPMAGNREVPKWLITHWAKGPFPVKPDLASSVTRLRGLNSACLTRFIHIGPGEAAIVFCRKHFAAVWTCKGMWLSPHKMCLSQAVGTTWHWRLAEINRIDVVPTFFLIVFCLCLPSELHH